MIKSLVICYRGRQTKPVDYKKMLLHDWMRCTQCGLGWFKVVLSGTRPYDFYHECEKCGEKHFPVRRGE